MGSTPALNLTEDFCRVTSNDGVGGDVFCDHCARSYNGIFTNAEVGKDSGARPDGGAFLDDRFLDLPVGFGLQTSTGGSGTWVGIIDEHHAMADKNVVFDGYTFTDEGVAGDLAAFSNRSLLLDLY